MITLKTLPQATAQQIFDQVATHLLTQNEKSGIVRENGFTCMYRSPDGCKCAAGCLISDDEYHSRFENITWEGLVIDNLVTSSHDRLIAELQYIHDRQELREWKMRLINLAIREKLDYSVLNNF